MIKAWKHLCTILHHKNLVRAGCFKIGLYKQGLLHDMSKYTPTEFLVGCKYYQGTMSPNNAEREDKGYSAAWLHHKGRNKHHMEYWIDYGVGDGRDGQKTHRGICTDLNPTLHQFFFGQSKFKHTVHTIKHRCSICTSTGHSRCDRNILVQLHIDTVPDLKFIHQKFCCLVDKIILICRQKRQICRHCNPACCLFHFKTVKQVDGLHDHFHFMVPILTSAHNIKPKIYFCKCFY